MAGWKLSIEIRKPPYAQNRTVRDAIPYSLWAAVRRHVHEQAGHRCQICGFSDEEKLQAHEVWSYDEERYLLILKDIQSLCRFCHDCKHLHHVGHRITDDRTRSFVMKNLKKHFIKVNGCTANDFTRHYRNQLAKSNPEPVKRSLEDLVEARERMEKEEFLMKQAWKFSVAAHVPLVDEIKNHLEKNGLLSHYDDPNFQTGS